MATVHSRRRGATKRSRLIPPRVVSLPPAQGNTSFASCLSAATPHPSPTTDTPSHPSTHGNAAREDAWRGWMSRARRAACLSHLLTRPSLPTSSRRGSAPHGGSRSTATSVRSMAKAQSHLGEDPSSLGHGISQQRGGTGGGWHRGWGGKGREAPFSLRHPGEQLEPPIPRGDLNGTGHLSNSLGVVVWSSRPLEPVDSACGSLPVITPDCRVCHFTRCLRH